MMKESEKKIMEYLKVIGETGIDANRFECVDDKETLAMIYKEYLDREGEITVHCESSV